MVSLAFKNGAAAGGFFSKAIVWKTGGPYSHVEMVFSGPLENSECFSSREPKGTGWAHLNLSDTKLWTIVPIQVTPEEETRLRGWCYGAMHKEYDFPGILGFVWPFGDVHDDSDLFCSECCTMALQQCCGWFEGLKPFKVSPSALYKLAISL